MNKHLSLDLDETLVSSMYANNEKHAAQLLNTYSKFWKGHVLEFENDGLIVSFVRPWAHELIQYFQTTLGYKNVGILSWGCNEYVLKTAKVMEFNIPPSNIFGREDMDGHSEAPRFKNKNNVLVDNEDYNYHRMTGYPTTKIGFLYGLPPEKLVTIPTFDVRYFREDREISLDDLIKKIEMSFDFQD